MLVDVVRSVSRRLLPGGRDFRKLPFGPAAGCTMKLNYHYDLRLLLGLYEIETQRWFRRLIKRGYNSFDVGGLGGYDALLLSKLSGGGKVISFECERSAVSEMHETFQNNKYPIQAVEAFISDRDGNGEMTLDAAADKFFVPDFIKMDIEGAEDRALVGAFNIITSRKPNMIIEVHGEDIEQKCEQLLRNHGYEPKIVNRNRFFGEKRPMLHNRWLICVGRD